MRLLFTIVCMMIFGVVGAQIAAWDFFNESSPVTSSADTWDLNLDSSLLLIRGDGAPATTNADNSFRAWGFKDDGISVANTDYFQFTLSASPGNTLSLTSIDAIYKGTSTFSASPGVANQYAYSLDGITFTLIGTPQMIVGNSNHFIAPAIDLSGIAALQNVPANTTVTFRYYASGQTDTGGWGYYSPNEDQNGLAIGGSITPELSGFITADDGPWDVSTTWLGGVVPTPADNVIVAHNVTSALPITRNAGSTTTILSSGTLQMANAYINNGTTTVDGSFQTGTAGGVSINPGSTFLVNGTFQINQGGFIQTGSPVYGASSTLIYFTNGNYGRGLEWSHLGIGTIGVSPGYPNHVSLQNNTIFDYNNGTPLAKAIDGNLTIDAGSAFYMDWGPDPSGGPLTIGGNLLINGIITLGDGALTDDLHLAGNLTVNAAGAFNGNNRAVIFTKPSGIQEINAAAGISIPYMVFSNSGSRTVQIKNSTPFLNVTAPQGGNAIAFGSADDVLDINEKSLTIGTPGVASMVAGDGTFAGGTSTTASTLTLLGNGDAGILRFKSAENNLYALTINRQAGQIAATLGSNLSVYNTLNLTNGLLDVGANLMTLGSGITINGGWTNSYIIADGNAGGALRRGVNSAGVRLYPLGDSPLSPNGTQYSPASVNFPTGSYGTNLTFSVSVHDDKHPEMSADAHFITRYWKTAKSGTFPGGDYTFIGYFLPADIVGTDSQMISDFHNGTNWTLQGGPVTAGANAFLVPVSGVPVGDFSAGLRDADMHIKGGGTLTQNILNGDVTPNGLDGTLFAAQNIGSSQDKTFRIQNLGYMDLDVTSIALTGDNPGDFSITAAPPYTIGPNLWQDFTVTFTPTLGGVRTAIVTLASNDPDENPYTFMVQGTGNCPAISITALPLSGPAGTIVTVNSASNLTGATASVGGTAAVVTSVSPNQIKVEVPAGASSGPLVVTSVQGCDASLAFTVFDNLTSACQGGNTVANLFISEVTDATSGGLTYVEIYNGTGSAVNLGSYSLQFAFNGMGYQTPIALNNVSLPNNSTFVVSVASDSVCSVPGGNGSYANQASTANGINFVETENDHVGLFQSGVLIDAFGEFGNDSWADALGLGDRGATFRRKNDVVVPSATYNDTDWDIIDWAGTGPSSCSTNDYSNIGTYNFIAGVPPTVTGHPAYVPTCAGSSLTVSATEGFAGGNALAYQWYANVPGNANWTPLVNNAVYSGVTTATLNISNVAGLAGYQYYVQVREDGASCYTASNATMVTNADTSTWNGTTWVPAPPSSNSIAVIAGNYNTAGHGSFEACSLTVNGGASLTIAGNTYVSIENNVAVNASGTLLILDDGSLVQVNDLATVINNGTTQVMRTTSAYNKFDYTYWSSPVANAGIGTTFAGWRTDYAFQFATANYADLAAPFDGFDDDNNAWVYTPPATVMTKGKGYAIMAPTGGTFPATSTVTFSGAVNNGIVTMPLAMSGNAASTNDDFNLVGNPYPSAIFADDFINANPAMDGTLYFWTHRTGISTSNPGPDANNFITDDYAMYNLLGGTASGVGSAEPTGYVASGQGFFIEAVNAASVTFNNSMRSRFYDNDLFYRPAASALASGFDRVWLDLWNEAGLFSQQLIGFTSNATLGYDRGYDGIVNPAANSVSFYSLIEQDGYRIQGRPLFDTADVVPLGYKASIEGTYSISIGKADGLLDAADLPVYLEDTALGTIHNLKAGPYSFTTQPGTFNERFVLRFDTALSVPQAGMDDAAVTAFAGNGTVHVRASSELKSIDIYDIRGRKIHESGLIGKHDFSARLDIGTQPIIVLVTLRDGETVSRKLLF